VVTGTWTNACVQHTVMGAWCRGYDVIVLKDCCSCSDEKGHDHAFAYMKQFYGTEAHGLRHLDLPARREVTI